MTPPVFAHGHLRLYLLYLLADRPMHGYELIQALGSRFGGTYVPSAGTIYPRLAKLEEDGLVTKSSDGRKTVYEITEAGRAELQARHDDLLRVESDVTDSVRHLADGVRASVNEAMKTLRADLASAARDARTDARESVNGSPVDPQRQNAALQLRQAETVINEFRHQLRTDLRSMAAKGRLPHDVAPVLADRLASVREWLRQS
ncbi:MAG: PadR family transcriptional regulator [Microbacteriaceae bacterium]|jgi:DNA-binding PadR family transcriptional regulator|nr:PadR family transcriptional regulator [Microbacteriaceae bacterium]